MKEKNKAKPIMPVLKKMKKGQKEVYDLSRLVAVRTSCWVLNKQLGFEYTTKSDIANKTLTVERL